jgi:DNA helicase-2/ATP-dependent DNA helicase PcrA
MKYLINDIDELLKSAVSVTLQQFFQDVVAKMGILKYIMHQQDKGHAHADPYQLFRFPERRKP